MYVDVLGGGVGVAGGIGEITRTTKHGEDDGKRLGGVREGDVENGARVHYGVNGGIVILPWAS